MLPRRRVSRRAMTLIELLVAIGVGSLLLMIIMVVFASSGRSFAAMGNYVDLDRASRNALDRMSRDIRRAKNLISYSTNQLVFNFAGTTNLIYEFDPDAGVLTSWKTGDSSTNYLLTGCEKLEFSMYRNIPLAGGVFAKTTIPAEGKSISVAWKCSRKILGKKVNSEDMQEALIVIRNKPVS